MLKACIVGFGAIGPVHAEVLNDIDRGSLYAICDIDENKINKAKDAYNIKFYNNYNDVLADSDIDVVHICTPHYLHSDMAIKAIESGKHVVLEKPLAISKDELYKLEECYKNNNRKVCVMLQNRYNNSVMKLKNIIDSGEYGKIISVCGSQKWYRNEEYYKHDSWRGKFKTEGGGLVINQSIHLVDMLGWLNGGIESVTASISTKRLGNAIEVEDTADAVFEFKNGLCGVYYATNTNVFNEPYMVEVRFEHAKFIYTENMLVKFQDGNVQKIAEDSETMCGKKCWGTSHHVAIERFYNSVINGTKDYINFEDSVNSMNAVYSIYESSANKNSKITV